MRPETLKELHDKNLLTEDQYIKLEAILSKKVFSVFYELRTLLYLGVMLFTTGVGILIYENIGELGHLAVIGALFVITTICFYYVFNKAAPYSHEKVKPPVPYFDYIVLLGCLLFISVQGYIGFQFDLLDENLGISTLITAAFFFYAAYRFDHLGVLSLAITALASFWSISLSPQKWYSDDFFSSEHLHITAIVFGLTVSGIAVLLDKKSIKQHFTFTYVNFGSLIFFIGTLVGLFDERAFSFYLLILYAGCALAIIFAHWKKSFLFLLYAFVFAYIGTTYLLADTIMEPELWFFYMIASCGGFIYFIIRFKNYFKRAE
ncbi:MAG TPA: DUF2157 domain-containing protein [Ohtaekwangia sp.]